MSGLLATLCAHAPPSLLQDAAAVTMAESALSRVVAEAAAAWPEFSVTPTSFVQHLAARLSGSDLTLALGAARIPDLYLACACLSGDKAALLAFDQRELRQVPLYVGHLRLDRAQVDEVQQQLRERLLVKSPDSAPRIGEYSGRGSLSAWVRVAAVRTALNLRRSKDEQVVAQAHQVEGGFGEAEALGEAPELRYLRQRYQGAFKAAFQEALASLPAEQRELLRLSLVEGLNSDQIAARLATSRATAARRVAAARQGVGERTRLLLEQRLQLSAQELRSLAGLVLSQLDVSIIRCLTPNRAG